ncbi:MAG: hypothetical protein IPM18_10510 [Phycisphaerales bacterium]|nr:hypothetical protein [Phycisphaerales bacterium]
MSRSSQRRGIAVVPVITFMVMIMLAVAVLARHTLHLSSVERQADEVTWLWRAAESARSWTEVRRGDWHSQELPLIELLPSHYTGKLRLERVVQADGAILIRCEVALQRGSRSIQRVFEWSRGWGPAMVCVEGESLVR